MPSVQSLVMTFDALREDATFTEGDALTGKVTLVLLKDTAVESLFVKAKGDAHVHWTRKSGDHTYTYSEHVRYFKLKQFLIAQESKNTVVSQGTHVYPFRINLPTKNMPSSYKAHHGNIVYKLEVKLIRSWRMNRTIEREIRFVSKSYPNLRALMAPQVGSTNKQTGIFSKGRVHMNVTLDRQAYVPGESISIVAKVNNESSTDMTPKFSLIQEVVFRAKGSTKVESETIHKLADNRISPHTQKEIRCAIRIPPHQQCSIKNCEVLTVEYHLKAYLDISFSFDPEIILPLVIFPHGLVPGFASSQYQVGAVGGPSNSDFPATAMRPYSLSPRVSPNRSPSRSPNRSPSRNDYHPPAMSVGTYPVSPRRSPSRSPNRSPSHNNFIPPTVSVGTYPISPGRSPSRSPSLPGSHRAQSYTPPPGYPSDPHAYSGAAGLYPAQPSPYGNPFSSPSSTLHPPPTAPAFPQSPSAPELHPPPPPHPPPPSVFTTAPSAPSYSSLLPSAPMMNTDFLSQSDEPPPSYTLLFPSSSTDHTNAE